MYILLFVIALCQQNNLRAQGLKLLSEDHDPGYILDLREYLTVRVFGANKFATYTPGDYGYKEKVTYRANDNYNLGVGFFYKFFGVNIAVKAPFVNNDIDRRGRTKYLDAQAFLYKRNLTADFYYRTHRGYYLKDPMILNTHTESNTFPQRPDLRTWTGGANLQYILNGGRFSYRAAFLQNEQQKKSAGSPVFGAGLHVTGVEADSAIIPGNIVYSTYFENSTFNKSNVVSVAVNAGYAHTLVVQQYWFATASLVGGAGVNYTTLKDNETGASKAKAGLQLDAILRLSAGYNSEEYFAGVQYINFINRNNAPIPGAWQQFQSGNIRLTLAKRVKLGDKTQARVDKIESNVKGWLGVE